MKFSWLKVLELDEDNSSGRGAFWKCECKCGNIVSLPGTKLRRGDLKSCGCLRVLSASSLNKTHGASHEPWYGNWRGMVYRTTNPKSPSFERYDKVIEYGEKIEPDFITDPWAFFEEIGEKPFPDYSIDRIDNSRGYVRGNIRWADAKTQYFNRNIIKRTEAETQLIDLATKASSKEELLSLLETQLDDTTFHSLSLP